MSIHKDRDSHDYTSLESVDLSSTHSVKNNSVSDSSLKKLSSAPNPTSSPTHLTSFYESLTNTRGGQCVLKCASKLSEAIDSSFNCLMSLGSESREKAKTRKKTALASEIRKNLRAIGNDETAKLNYLKGMIKEGQQKCNTGAYFTLAATLTGGLIGFGAGYMLHQLTGPIAMAAGVLGGLVIGGIVGHAGGEYCAEWLLQGMGIDKDDDKHKATQFLVKATFGVIGAGLGLVGGTIGGSVAGFLGELCIIGGFTKLGFATGYLASSLCGGKHMDNIGWAYKEAAMEAMAEEGLKFDSSFSTPTTLSSTFLEKLGYNPSPIPTTFMETTAKKVGYEPKVNTLRELLIPPRPTEIRQESEEVQNPTANAGTKARALYQSFQNVQSGIQKGLSDLSEYLMKVPSPGELSKKEQTREARMNHYNEFVKDTIGQGKDNKDYSASNILRYGTGLGLCTLAVITEVIGYGAGIGAGLTAGAVAVGAAVPIVIIGSILGGIVEGAVIGAAKGYVAAEFMLPEEVKNAKAAIKIEYKQLEEKGIATKESFEDFEKRKLTEMINPNEQNNLRTKMYTAGAIGMGIVGGLLGATTGALFATAKSPIVAWMAKVAVLGGSVKAGMLAGDTMFGYMAHNLYSMGSALEYASVGAIGEKGVVEEQKAFIHRHSENTTGIELN